MQDHPTDVDVLIVGAGLAGLACADLLHESGLSVIVLEATSRVGGRIQSVMHPDTRAYLADLGPTWVWPPYQPAVSTWLKRLNIETFAQYEDGDGILDMNEGGSIQRQMILGQHGMCRLRGGPQALIDALSKRVPQNLVRTNHVVTGIDTQPDGLAVTISIAEKPAMKAKHVIVAVPPRMAAQNINWSTELAPAVLAHMSETPTWMAAQAKAAILFERPFWREQGLSGRVASRVGPLVEIHDHCAPDAKEAALFGFIGWPQTLRQAEPSTLRENIKRQLVRCFGNEGTAFTAMHIEDWSTNPHICSDLDLTRPPSHPEVTPNSLRIPHYDGRLFFAVAETATQSPGLIDGALSAATETAHQLLSRYR